MYYLQNGIKYHGFQLCKNLPQITYNITFIFDKVENRELYGRVIIKDLFYDKIMTYFEGIVLHDTQHIIHIRLKEIMILEPLDIDYSTISIAGYYNMYINKSTKGVTGYYFDETNLNLHNICLCLEYKNFSESYEFN